MTDENTTAADTPGSTVLICDERPVARRELTIQLTAGATPSRVTTTGCRAEMIEKFAVSPTGVVMLRVHHGSGTGTAGMTLLLDEHPTARVIAYGGVQDYALLVTAMARGARGLMVWDVGQPLHLRPVLAGSGPRSQGGGPRSTKPIPPLTEREMQILKGMSNGQPNSAIGRELYISEDTVKTHARRLFNKIGAFDRAHAVALGFRGGLL